MNRFNTIALVVILVVTFGAAVVYNKSLMGWIWPILGSMQLLSAYGLLQLKMPVNVMMSLD